MRYEETDFSTIERHAWAAGDQQTAQLAAAALGYEEAQQRADELENIVGGIRERITEANWRTGKKAELRELIEAIIGELAEGAGV